MYSYNHILTTKILHCRVHTLIQSLFSTFVMNAPDRFLTWHWESKEDEERERLKYIPDSKKPNAGLFLFTYGCWESK